MRHFNWLLMGINGAPACRFGQEALEASLVAKAACVVILAEFVAIAQPAINEI